MFDDDNDQYGFWSDEPTRALDRLAARRKPAGPAPIAPTRRPRPVDPQVGRRQHGDTQQIPVISTEPVTSTRGGARPARPHIDPLLRRMGGMAVAVALCVPVAMSLRGGDASSSLQAGSAAQSSQSVQSDNGTDGAAATVGAAAAETAASQSVPAASVAPETNAPNAALPAASDAAETSAVAETASAPATPATGASVARVVSAVPAASPVIEAVAETVATSVAPQCAKEYDVVAGDYWILIAKKVSVSLKEVLAANGATTDSPIYPGRTVCLPATASTPTTAAAAAAAAPTTVKASTTTAAATTTTAKATTTTVAVAVKTTSTSTPAAAAPAASYSRTAVEAIIRQVWPDNLEDEAVRIATRESNLIPTVRNYCCFGLFQVYFNVHKTWLAQSGVTSPEQLYDPLTNAYIAYAMYLKAGGWGPWGM